MKRLAILALTLVLALCLAACGGGGAGASAADPVALGKSLSGQAADLPSMETVSSESEDGEQLFKYLSDLDYGKVAGYYMSYAAAGTAEEIAVIRLRDSADAAEARASLERHLESRRGLFRVYDPEQAAMLEKAVLVSEGDVVAIIICENASDLAGSLRSELRG